MKLFLDDERTPEQVKWRSLPRGDLFGQWKIVRNFEEFKQAIDQGEFPEYITFDHDLGIGYRDGYDCAKYLVDYCDLNNQRLPKVQVHSMNPVGAKNIIEYFKSAIKHGIVESDWL